MEYYFDPKVIRTISICSRIRKNNTFGDRSVYHIAFITAKDATQQITPSTICLYDIFLSSFCLGWATHTSGSDSCADPMSNRTYEGQCDEGGKVANMVERGSRVEHRRWLW